MNLTPETVAIDPRVRRSRSALMQATVTLVAERGTAAVPVSEIAEAADVSRPLVYQHFGNLDRLLLESAVDLATRELLPRMADAAGAGSRRDGALSLTRHFAEHRSFYRAVLTSSCAFALNKALTGLLIPINRQLVHDLSGGSLDAQGEDDLATFITGGGAAFVNTWVVEAPDPLDPDEFADRLMRLSFASLLLSSTPTTATTTPPKEPKP